ncbi:MAG: Deazaflavin-dependent nitroreductase [Pseudomonadales bacterium]|nr:Deazaflavin-dependent nitroreductase [Pseudomonadales bacterium]
MAESILKRVGWLAELRSRWMALLRNIITRTNLWLLRTSGGRLGNSFLGRSVMLLHTIGHRSGAERVIPIFYLSDGERIVLVASNAGTTTDPAWLINMRAHPAVAVTIRGHRRAMTARVADDDEHRHYWPRVAEMFPVWEMVQNNSLRRFPIVVLEPRAD